MKALVIHGSNNKRINHRVAMIFAKELSKDIEEIFLPKDFDEFCRGCWNCFKNNENLCPHFNKLSPIVEKMENADVIILASPVYVFHITAAMKTLLDHLAYRAIVHRPSQSMFEKDVICVTTAMGVGNKSALKDLRDSAFLWGSRSIYCYGFNVKAEKFELIDKKIVEKIEYSAKTVSNKIKRTRNKKPSIKTRAFFFIISKFMKKGLNKSDYDYWKANGWLDGKYPWKI